MVRNCIGLFTTLSALLWIAANSLSGGVHSLSKGALRVEIEVDTDLHAGAFGPRFDRTAVVRQVTVDGLDFLGPWGLCDEFGLYGNGVLGYEDAEAGGSFLKIGVGRLTRDSGSGYHFAHPYPVGEYFAVETEAAKDFLTVIQRSDPLFPQRYAYRKTYALGEDNSLTIRYRLTNTGEAPWSFEHYNHHWFRLEGADIGPRYRCRTVFALPEAETGFLRGDHSLRMKEALAPEGAVYYASDLPGAAAEANRFTIEVDGKPMVDYAGSFAPVRFALYASADGFCPEVFKRATLGPGESASWSSIYRFRARHGAADGEVE